MTELAFLIFATVGLVATAKIWKPFLMEKADELEISNNEKRIDQQEDLHKLNNRIDEVKAKHNGEWYTLAKIESKMK